MNSYTMTDHTPDAAKKHGSQRGTALVISTISIFVALMIVGIGMIVGAREVTDAFDQSALMQVGGAIVGGALAFFLVQMFSYARAFGQFRDE